MNKLRECIKSELKELVKERDLELKMTKKKVDSLWAMMYQQDHQYNEIIREFKVEVLQALNNLEKEFAIFKNDIKEEMQSNNWKYDHKIKALDEKIAEVRKDFSSMITQLTDLKSQLKGNFSISSALTDSEKFKEKKAREVERLENNTHVDKINVSLKHEVERELPELMWEIPQIQNKVGQEMTQIAVAEFQLTEYPFRARISMEINEGNYARITLQLLDQNNKEIQDLQLWPRVYYILKDLSGNNERKDIIWTSNMFYPIPKFNSAWNYLVNFDGFVLNKPMYKLGNSNFVEVYVESPQKSRRFYSNNGVLESSVDNFWKCKSMEKDGLRAYHLSPSFYTGPRGYRFEADIYLNGRHKFFGKGLSFFVVNVKGEFDDNLDVFLPHKTIVTLRNSLNSKPITSFKFNYLANSADVINFSQEDVDKSLSDGDTLFYKVEIEVF